MINLRSYGYFNERVDTEFPLCFVAIVMSYPGNNLEETCAFLDTNHAEQYLVFNLSDKSYDTSLLHNQVGSVWLGELVSVK